MAQSGLERQALVWVTRPEPQASAHAAALTIAGLKPLLSPVLNINVLPTPEATPVLPGQTAGLIFTSINGLTHFPKHWLAEFENHPVFVSGTTTQKAAMEFGFSNVSCSVSQGSRGIVELVRNRMPTKAGATPSHLLYLAGTTRTPFLEAELKADFNLKVTELYAAEVADQLSDLAQQAFQSHKVAATTLFSARSAEHAATLLHNHFETGAKRIQNALLAVCISHAVAERAQQAGFVNTSVAKFETADSVVTELVKQLKIHPNSFKSI